jgi:hypothetical protein
MEQGIRVTNEHRIGFAEEWLAGQEGFWRQPTLVAAGVALVGHKNELRAGRNGLRARRLAECAQDAKNCNVGGENAEANGGDHGKAENKRHQERNHSLNILPRVNVYCSYYFVASRKSCVLNLPALTLRAIDD